MTRSATVLAAFLCSAVASAQQRPFTLPPNNQETTLFRGLLHFHKIEPEVRGNIVGRYDYSNLIVVVYGDPKNQEVVKVCRSTLAGGGAVLIAADTELAVGTFLPGGGEVRVTGSRVRFGPGEGVDGGQPGRPIVAPLPTDGVSPFDGVRRVATLDPSYLLAPNPPAGMTLKPVAAFPSGATVTTPAGRPIVGLGILALPFALATTDPRVETRLMVVADPDVFSNRMIYTSGREGNPTDNLRLANNTVQWLKGAGRTKCLFVENGEPKTKFDEFEFSSIPVGIPPIPPPPVPNIDLLDPELQQGLANTINQAVDQVERNDSMNQGLLSLFRGSKAMLVSVLAVLLAFVVYVIFWWRTRLNWYRKVFRPIPRDPAMLGPDVPVGSLGHRRLELLRSADYGPVVRPVVRQLFQDRGLPGEYTADKLPPLDIDVRNPKYLRDAIHTLWVAVRTTAPIGYGWWKQLEPLLAAVRAAATDDRWRFVAPSPRDAAS